MTKALAQHFAAAAGSVPWEDPPRGRAQATSPVLVVDGFEGPLDWLLEMARAKTINLARLSIVALVDAFGDAMDKALWQAPHPSVADLSHWAAWTVMAAQLIELRSRLLLPADSPQARTAQGEAEALRRQLIRREEVAAAATWLERQPQLGAEVFTRGRPETFSAGHASVTTERQGGDDDSEQPWTRLKDTSQPLEDLPVPGGDLTDLLRACLVALQRPPTISNYQPRRLPFWRIGEATARIGQLLDGLPDGAEMGAFLPRIADHGPSRALRCRAAVAATFVAGLELTRNGAVTLDQDQP